MADLNDGAIDGMGWTVAVDPGTGEVRLDHESGSSYVLEGDGDVRMPGEGEIGEAVHGLQATMAGAIEEHGGGGLSTAAIETDTCTVRRDDATGEIVIESDVGITMAAPTIDVEGRGPIDISSPGQVTVSKEPGPGMAIELPDGSQWPVAPVESDGPVEAYYGFDTDNHNAAATPDGLERTDATVTFVHRNAETGERSLVIIHDHPASDAGGAAVLTVEGASGAEWLVQDDTEAITPPQDRYETTDGAVGESESVAWKWNADRTDGGALGPLGGSFDVEITHRAGGTVVDQTRDRSGLDHWVFLDGRDPGNPIEIAAFDGTAGDVVLRLFTTA